MTERLISVHEAADVLSVTVPYVRILAKNGEFRTVKIGKRGVRYFESDLRDFIERRQTSRRTDDLKREIGKPA